VKKEVEQDTPPPSTVLATREQPSIANDDQIEALTKELYLQVSMKEFDATNPEEHMKLWKMKKGIYEPTPK
jgi:hypothetical protein